MRVSRLLIIIFLLLSYSASAQLTLLFRKEYQPVALKEDINFTKSKLEELHPDLYWYITKEALNKKFDSLKAAITRPITGGEFRNKLATVLASIGDGHMSLSLNVSLQQAEDARKNTTKIFPIEQFDYKIVDHRLYILKNNSADKRIAAGAEILTINKQPVKQVINKLIQAIPTDGYNQTLKYYYLNNGQLPDFFNNLYGLKDTLFLEINQHDTIRNVILTSVPWLKKRTSYLQVLNKFKSLGNSTAYLNPVSFRRQQFQDPYKQFFKTIKRDTIASLILDLRDNTGGDYEITKKLFAYLINQPAYFALIPKEILDDPVKTPPAFKYGITTPVIPDAFTGKLYVLINAGSFSATAMLAANLQADNRAVFVGEETGGGRDGCTGGLFKQIQLPNTGFTLKFGIVPFKVSRPGKLKGRGILPDIPITYTINDYLLNKDLEMEWVKNDIARHQQ